MTEVEVSLVPPQFVWEVWPKMRSCMSKASEYTHGRYTTEDILESVIDGNHHLWIAHEGQDIFGAVVTHIAEYPRMRCLTMDFVGGERVDDAKDKMLATLRNWAKDNDCEVIESSGRVGWSKVFRDDGYRMLWQTYELPVEAGDDDGSR